ncbi:MAG: rhomboid family intramembrane serine protease [Clostridiales bacterium]|nr:rhomboid family intramembrane serine protease [Clostridiales bacterium]MDD6936831.1 rhomboid family intramembrane serine protease [Clostridiales bacterium]
MKKRSITILYNSPVILTFALLSLLALALGKLTGGWTTQNLFCVYRSPLTDLLTYPRFFLHVLGNPDFAACCTNIVIMLAVGPMAEERFGSKRLLLAIAVTALVTGLVLWFFFPNAALMGASGVVFMLIVLASFAGVRGGTIPLTLILVLALYLGGEIVQAVTGEAGLQQLTHIAGGVVGVIFGFWSSRGKRK